MKTEAVIGFVISGIGVLPFCGGGFLNITKSPVARKNIAHVGYPPEFLTHFGISVIAIGILTLLPWTSFPGVILATAWMGGAIAAHVRVRDPWSFQLVSIVMIPVLIWIGFGLRHQAEMHKLLGF
jgi:hypothetical protein